MTGKWHFVIPGLHKDIIKDLRKKYERWQYLQEIYDMKYCQVIFEMVTPSRLRLFQDSFKHWVITVKGWGQWVVSNAVAKIQGGM